MTYREFINSNPHIEKEAILLLITEKMHIHKWELNLDAQIDFSLEEDLKMLKNNIPVQYVLGYAYFYKSKFKVTKDVLIPRFDTEILVEETLKVIKEYKNPKVLDLCTGSGCIGISLKKEEPSIDMTCSDISQEAIDVAKFNACYNNVEINFIKSDLLSNIKDSFDIIVSNPPYIDINEDIMDLVKNNEPALALFSANKGMHHYQEILKQSKTHLNDNGCILFEIPSHKDEVFIELVSQYFDDYKIVKDNNNLSRVIILKKRRIL